MPNYCNFSLKVKGSKEDVARFKAILEADYNTKRGLENPIHFYRIFEIDDYDGENYEFDEETQLATTEFYGYCAWSVFACMRNGQFTYYTPDNQDNGTCLEKLTKELNLVVEYYSEESGVGFQEHCIINRGKIEDDSCVKWIELDISECECLQDLLKKERRYIVEYFYNVLEISYEEKDLNNFKYPNTEDIDLKDFLRDYFCKAIKTDDLVKRFNHFYEDLERKFEIAKQGEDTWLSLGGFKNTDFLI